MTDVALFGAGRIGKIHAGNLVRQPGVTLKYVVDVNAAAAGELAQKYGAKVGSADQAFGDAAVKVAVIASSTDTHAELIRRAAAAKKAIFCEKPVDLSLSRARECQQAVADAGVTCLIGFQRRYDPTFAALKKRLGAGEIGEPEMLVITSRDPGAPPVDYMKVSGGIFKDMLIHDFDIFRWILGDEAASVYATGSCLTDPAIAASGDIDSTAVTIRTKKGRLAQINTSRRAADGYGPRVEVLGSQGWLQGGKLVAACSPLTEELAWARETLGVRNLHADYEVMLAQSDVDAVFLVTPTALHPEQIIAGLQAGKHVFCEKPLALDISECRRVEAEAAKHPKLKVMIGYGRRFDPSYSDAYAKVQSGLIGTPFLVRSQNLDMNDPSGFFLRFAPTSGGIFLDCSVHDIDFARWFLGAPKPLRVFAAGTIAIHQGLRDFGDHDTGV